MPLLFSWRNVCAGARVARSALSRIGAYALLAAMCAASLARADIRDTKHNLSGKTLDAKEKAAMTSAEDRRWLNREVCIFCHTPSVADDIALHGTGNDTASAPKWQQSLAAEFSYDIFDDIGRLGGDGDSPVGSVSVACLSCHDSTQAFGVGQSSDNHPFGVPYRGAVHSSNGGAATPLAAPSAGLAPSRVSKFIREDSEFRPVRSGVINRRTIWWASVFDSGQRNKNDLPLYPRRESSDSEIQIPYVECTSCHDPHTDQTVFLRIANDQARLCGTCHVK